MLWMHEQEKKRKSWSASDAKWFIKQRKLSSIRREFNGLFMAMMAFKIFRSGKSHPHLPSFKSKVRMKEQALQLFCFPIGFSTSSDLN